jgi:hypothetical protein
MEKFELLLSLTFMVAHFAMAATMGDWFVFKKTTDVSIGTGGVNCTVYKGEAYNLFGSMCGISISTAEEYMTTLQIILPSAFAFSLVLFFLMTLKRLGTNMIRITAFIIIVLELTACILWQTSTRVDLPIDSSVNYYGVGWIMTIVTAIFAFFIIIVV